MVEKIVKNEEETKKTEEPKEPKYSIIKSLLRREKTKGTGDEENSGLIGDIKSMRLQGGAFSVTSGLMTWLAVYSAAKWNLIAASGGNPAVATIGCGVCAIVAGTAGAISFKLEQELKKLL